MVNWENDNLNVASFQDPFLMGLWNVTDLGTSTKLIYFETQIAGFVEISIKLCSTFFTESAAFPGKFTNLLLLVYIM